MKTEFLKISGIPAVLYGEPSEKGYLFIHGQGGNKEEAAAFAEIANPAGYQVMGIDLPEHGARKGRSDIFCSVARRSAFTLALAAVAASQRSASSA